MQKCANIIQTERYCRMCLVANIGFDPAENGGSKVYAASPLPTSPEHHLAVRVLVPQRSRTDSSLSVSAQRSDRPRKAKN